MSKSLVVGVLVLLIVCSVFADDAASQTKEEEPPKQINQGGSGYGGGGSGYGGGGSGYGGGGSGYGGGGSGYGGGRRRCCGGYYYSRGRQICRRRCGEENEAATENMKNSHTDRAEEAQANFKASQPKPETKN